MPTVKELKQRCKDAGLSTEGKKADLIKRLEDYNFDAIVGNATKEETPREQQTRTFLKAKRDHKQAQADYFNRKFRR